MAKKKRFIQHNNPALLAWLVFDIDRPEAVHAWELANLPPPAWIAENPANGHAHVAYGLLAPVCRTEAARVKPLRYAAAVERGLTLKLKADAGYAGLITKNPLHAGWKVTHPSDWVNEGVQDAANAGIYELSYLAEFCDTSLNLKKPVATGLGRNVILFDTLREWAYKAARQYWAPGGGETFDKVTLAQAEQLNTQFPQPLPQAEIKATAKSVARWVWRRFNPAELRSLIERTHTPELQAKRGVASGKARKAASADKRASAKLMRASGMTQVAIAAEMGVGQSTISAWLAE